MKDISIIDANSLIPDAPNGVNIISFYNRNVDLNAVKILALGDIGLFGSVDSTIKNEGIHKPLEKISAILRRGDIVFGNLETVILDNVSPDMLFCACPCNLQLLSDNNFKILHLANNHIYDYGREGLESTIFHCKNMGLIPLGVGATKEESEDLILTEVKGLKIGWLGCGHTLKTQGQGGPCYWEFDGERLKQQVINLRNKLDILIISIHIGLMYLDYPDPRHKIMAGALVEAGADIVLMHHAHVVQGVSTLENGKVIFFNLGNFLWDWKYGNVKSDIMRSEQNEGFIFIFFIDKIGISFVGALPIYIDDNCCVNLADEHLAKKIMQRLIKISLDLEQDYTQQFINQRVERNLGHFLKVLWFHIKAGNWIFIRDTFKNIRREHFRILFHGLVNKLK